jgi:NADH-quinone oxidoreductase subunit E
MAMAWSRRSSTSDVGRRLSRHQPASFAFSDETRRGIEFWLSKFPEPRRQSGVIPILWLVQKQEGWVSEPSLRAVSELLGMPFIRVLEVATFYTMFQLEPVGSRALIQVCGTTPCRLRGAEAIMDVCKSKIGPKDRLTADGLFTWQEVECLGACVNAPMAQINDYYYEDLTPRAWPRSSTSSPRAARRSRASMSSAPTARPRGRS